MKFAIINLGSVLKDDWKTENSIIDSIPFAVLFIPGHDSVFIMWNLNFLIIKVIKSWVVNFDQKGYVTSIIVGKGAI